MPPPEKKTKIFPLALTCDEVHEKFGKILKHKNPAKKYEGFEQLRSQGYIKDITDSFVSFLSYDFDTEVLEKDIGLFYDYFTTMTAAQAAHVYSSLREGIEENSTSHLTLCNLVRFMGAMIMKVELAMIPAFTEILRDDLPTIIHTIIPKTAPIGTRLHLCRAYAYVLSIVDENTFDNRISTCWGRVYREDLFDSPFMTLLTRILGEPTVADGTKQLVKILDMESNENILSERNQIYNLALDHFSCLPQRLAKNLHYVTYSIVEEAIKRKELVAVIRRLQKDYSFHSSSKEKSRYVFDALFAAVSNSYSPTKDNNSMVHKWVSYTKEILKRREPLEYIEILEKFTDLISDVAISFKENETLEQVLCAMQVLEPMRHNFQVYTACLYFFFILLTVSGAARSPYFQRIAGVAAQYLTSKEHGLGLETGADYLFEHFWVPGYAASYDPEEKFCSRELFVKAFGEMAYNVVCRKGKFDYSIDSLPSFDSKRNNIEETIMDYMLTMKTPAITLADLGSKTSKETRDKLAKALEGLELAAKHKAIREQLKFEDVADELKLFQLTALTALKRPDRAAHVNVFIDAKDQMNIIELTRKYLFAAEHTPGEPFNICVRRAYTVYSILCPAFEIPDFSMDELANLNTVSILYEGGLDVLRTFLNRCRTEVLFKLLESCDETNCPDKIFCILAEVINISMIKDLKRFTILCNRAVVFKSHDLEILVFLAKVVELVGLSKSESSPLLTLSLCVCSVLTVPNGDWEGTKLMNNFLLSCVKFCTNSLLMNQCSLYAALVTRHFKQACTAIENPLISREDAEIITYGCAKISDHLAKNEKPVKRIVAFILSETVMCSKLLELAFAKLHQVGDTHSQALLAVALPSIEKRQYARTSETLKKVYKETV